MVSGGPGSCFPREISEPASKIYIHIYSSVLHHTKCWVNFSLRGSWRRHILFDKYSVSHNYEARGWYRAACTVDGAGKTSNPRNLPRRVQSGRKVLSSLGTLRDVLLYIYELQYCQLHTIARGARPVPVGGGGLSETTTFVKSINEAARTN